MSCLLIVALWLYDSGKAKGSALVAGLSIALKLVPLAILPWIVLSRCGAAKSISPKQTIVTVLLLFGPTLAFMALFWEHGSAILGLLNRLFGPSNGHAVNELLDAQDTSQHGLASIAARLIASRIGPIALYAAITALLLFRQPILRNPRGLAIATFFAGRGDYPVWLPCWVLFAALAGFTVDIKAYWYSWFSLWSILPAACIWTKRGNPMLVCSMITALADALKYMQMPG